MPTARIAGVDTAAGAELLRILLDHPAVEVVAATAPVDGAIPLGELRPEFDGRIDLPVQPTGGAGLETPADVTLIAAPDSTAMEMVPRLLERNERVIDLSGASRLADPEEYEAWNGREHTAPETLDVAVYGFPELNSRAIRQANLVAVPGAFATAAVLAAVPAIAEGLVDPGSLVVTAVAGAALGDGGSGHANDADNAFICRVGIHPQVAEMEQALEVVAGKPVRVSFTPYRIPVSRGILATCILSLEGRATLEEVHEIYERHYGRFPFVRVSEAGRMPDLAGVLGANFCEVGAGVDPRTRRLIVAAALDDLIKGAAGLAVQNLNLMFDREETEGLLFPGLPV